MVVEATIESRRVGLEWKEEAMMVGASVFIVKDRAATWKI